jgi:hypothetical protein
MDCYIREHLHRKTIPNFPSIIWGFPVNFPVKPNPLKLNWLDLDSMDPMGPMDPSGVEDLRRGGFLVDSWLSKNGCDPWELGVLQPM